MTSVWSDNTELPKFRSLENDINVDVLVVGGGLAGILCAHMLSRKGVSYALLEANRICSGITKNTTAKITSQHGLIYHKLIRDFGTEKAKMYLDANTSALNTYRQLCQNIDCDFQEKDSAVYSLHGRKVLEDELNALSAIGAEASFVSELPLPFPIDGAVKFKKQAQFNPLKFVSEISRWLNIFENSGVRQLIGCTAVTGHGKVKAKKIIVATHFPFINKHGSYFLKMYQHRSYVLALENAQDVDGMYVDESQKGLSFRNYGNLLLLGGGSHRTGKRGGNWHELSYFAGKFYPYAEEKYRWATQDCMTLDGVPYIGQYSKNTPDLYVTAGFNKWGMTSSMAAAKLLCDLVTGKENPCAPLFSPSRSILRPQLAVNTFESAVNLLTPTGKRCPHLGCALKWNSHEHSWDCPCHGSRFTEGGKLIDNPATGDLKKSDHKK